MSGSNYRRMPVMSQNFFVMFGPFKIGFTKVSSFDVSYECEVLAEGGVNNKVRTLRAPQKNEKVIVMERGAVTARDTMDYLLLEVLKTDLRFPVVFIGVNDARGRMKKFYTIFNAKVKKWSLSDLVADTAGILIETLEFAYEYIEEIPVPSDTWVMPGI